MSEATLLQEAEREYQFGFHDEETDYVYRAEKGLSRDIVQTISREKNEPAWMLAIRLEALEIFLATPMPEWGADLSGIDFGDIHYFMKASEGAETLWSEVPDYIKNTFDRLGIPEAERKFLAGVSAQYDSEVVYHSIREDLQRQGVIFLDMDSGLREYPELVREHFGTVIPSQDNKFAALNTAVWSGGSFVVVPAGVHVEIPLQAYFRINAENMGQFERTLILAMPGSYVHYIEGCTAPTYTTNSLHSAVVEVKAMEGSVVRYTTIQNWSDNIFNLVTKRAFAYKNSRVEWIDGNLGSKVTMKYPSVHLLEEGARGEVLSIAYAGRGQHQDAGAKMVHHASNTCSTVLSKSISRDGGRSSYRGQIKVLPGVAGVRVNVRCDALLLDPQSRSDTYPLMEILSKDVLIGHEATVSRIGDDELFYLRSRGLSENAAMAMLINGFFEPFVRQLPMEYAVELNRLMELQMSGSIG